jgi:thiol-disulfide isomerase/thioredoxin
VPPIDIDGAIKMQRGKIVVVDIWATWCVPCKKEFPHLVELHQKRAKDGVVCMSVAWDSADDRDKALEFLQQRGATFPNFLLNKDDKDGTQKWLDAYDIGPIPVVLVFGRDGKLAKKFDREDPDHPFTYADVNKLVEELLKK